MFYEYKYNMNETLTKTSSSVLGCYTAVSHIPRRCPAAQLVAALTPFQFTCRPVPITSLLSPLPPLHHTSSTHQAARPARLVPHCPLSTRRWMREFLSSFFLTIWFGPLHPSFHLPLPLLLSPFDTCPPQPPTSHVLLSVSQPFVLPKSPFAFSVSCLLQLPSLLKPFCTLVFPQVLSLLFLPPAPSVPCYLLPHSFPFSPLPLPPLSLTASLLHVFSLLSPPSFSLPRLPLLPFLGYFPSLPVPSFSPSFPLFPLLSPCPLLCPSLP